MEPEDHTTYLTVNEEDEPPPNSSIPGFVDGLVHLWKEGQGADRAFTVAYAVGMFGSSLGFCSSRVLDILQGID